MVKTRGKHRPTLWKWPWTSRSRRMGKDKQGKTRGKCGHEGCTCEEFVQPERGVKCGACKHVPTKHLLIDSGTEEGGGGSSGPQLHSIPPGHDLCRSCGEVYSVDELGLCPRCYPRNKCNYAGCSQPAYFSQRFYNCGPFDYCSPQCRDQDLVTSGKAKQESEDLLDQLRKHHREALHRETPVRGGASMQLRSGRQLSRSSTEATKMEVGDNLMQTDDQGRVKTPRGASEDGAAVDDISDPAPKKIKRDEEDNHGEKQSSQQERRASNILHIDLTRQASKRLGLIFHSDQQHGLMVTAMDINVIYKNCEVRLLDVVTEVDSKTASVQQFGKIRAEQKGTAQLTVIRNPQRTLSCADIAVKDWSGGKRKTPKPCTYLMAIQLLSSQRKAGSLGAILGVDLSSEDRVVKLHRSSVAADHGMLEGDVIIGAGVLPVGKKEGKVPNRHWSREEVATQLANDSGRVFVCVFERTNKE